MVFKNVDCYVIIVQEEIFGLVVIIIWVVNFDEVLEIVNGIDYVLMGGFYFCILDYINCVVVEFEVGNFYINCIIIGAIVFC